VSLITILVCTSLWSKILLNRMQIDVCRIEGS
jgi:hypothetical protein